MKKLALALALTLLVSLTGLTAMVLMVGGAGISAAATCPTLPLPDLAPSVPTPDKKTDVTSAPPGRKDDQDAKPRRVEKNKAKAKRDKDKRDKEARPNKRQQQRASAAPSSEARAPATPAAPARASTRVEERWSAEQLANAAAIVATGQALAGELAPTSSADPGTGADTVTHAQALAVMTAIGESSLRNLDHGDAAGPDSRGLFQQRANGAWGTYTDRMTPSSAAASFYRALAAVPGWQTMAPTLAAHAVQRNADPYHYAGHWPAAVELVTVLANDPALAAQLVARLPAAGALGCAALPPHGISGVAGGSGPGRLPAQGCTEPDPTRPGGCLTPRTAALAAWLLAQASTGDGAWRWSVSCWDAHAWNPTSDHPDGRACDVFPGPAGALPTAAQQATGDALAQTLQANAGRVGVDYLIWAGRIWSVERAAEGWRPYTGGGVYDPADITGGHHDHLHISMR